MLYGWMKSLIIYLIFAGAIINLSPSGNYKKYIRFFTGIVAIIILMNPISYIFNFDEKLLYGVYEDIGDIDMYDMVGPKENKTDYYDMSLSEGIRYELVNRGYGVEKVEVITNEADELLSCRVYVNTESSIEESFEENKIKSFVNEVYNLRIDNIYVVRR